jgi:ATP-dependent Clp protease ATP-binding subunit ClpB
MALLRASFRPEFLNRVDEIVLFKPLRMSELHRIVDIQIGGLRKRLAARRIALQLDDSARDYLARESYDPAYGARPLKRLIQRELETQIARALLAANVQDGSTIHVTASDGTLAIETRNPGVEGAAGR